jgi:alpha-beta hydrolase superfamily lysophospholipase
MTSSTLPNRARYLEPERFQMASADGLTIECVKWTGHRPVRGVVQIAHGLGEHVDRYAELAETLVRTGYVVYGNDHRGHGLTARRGGHFGDFGPGGFNQVVEDMVRLRVIAKNDYPGRPYILIGHGMGSFAAQQFILDHSHSIDGILLSGSGILDGLARLSQNLPATGDVMQLMNASFEPARTPFDWLSRDTAEVDAFIADPLRFPSLTAASMESYLEAFPRLADPRQIRKVRQDLPIYLFSGGDDPVGQRSAGVRALVDRYRSSGICSITYEIYPGGRHEMLHEINRREVVTDLLVWMSGVFT